MSIRTKLLPVVDKLRALRGPGKFDIETIALTIIVQTWDGGFRGSGNVTVNSTLALPQRYKIRQPSMKEISSLGGEFRDGIIVVDPITPAYTGLGGGGYTPAQLFPIVTANGQEVIYRLTGDTSGDFGRLTFEAVRPFRYKLFLVPLETTPAG